MLMEYCSGLLLSFFTFLLWLLASCIFVMHRRFFSLDIVQSSRPLPLRDVLTIFAQIVAATAHLHSQPRPITHRDLKLEMWFVVLHCFIDLLFYRFACCCCLRLLCGFFQLLHQSGAFKAVRSGSSVTMTSCARGTESQFQRESETDSLSSCLSSSGLVLYSSSLPFLCFFALILHL